MSGPKFFNQKKVLQAFNRRGFLLRAGLITSGILLDGCIKKLKPGTSRYSGIKGSLKGPDATAGHILRDKQPLPEPTQTRTVKTLIVGGGIAGLSAARWLKKQGVQDFEVIELENESGGNSRFGTNASSAYPLGAHYITIANNHDKELIDFLTEAGIITHFEKDLPVYNEFALCFDPQERLLINGQWQEGLVPDFGVPEKDKQQIKAFFRHVEALKNARGTDGKYAFDIPLNNSSSDKQFRELDQISFDAYLKMKRYDSPYLRWYLEYCCKDDYGQKLERISAWAGLHYFAGRKGVAANAENNAILTWPEGNGYLMKKLREGLDNVVTTGKLAYRIHFVEKKVLVTVYDTQKHCTETIVAEKVLLACPQFVVNKLISPLKRTVNLDLFHYAPWLIANITLKALPGNKGIPLSWDNVAFNTASVGYVRATHQQIETHQSSDVLTYYLPLCEHESRVSRLAAYARTYEQWLEIVMPELEFMHPGILEHIESVDLWLWGHGMISPGPGFIWGKDREGAQKTIDNIVFFAHSDLSGISIFEEAFYQGIRAAQQIFESA